MISAPEAVPGYSERIPPKSEDAAKELKKRALTDLYKPAPRGLIMPTRGWMRQ